MLNSASGCAPKRAPFRPRRIVGDGARSCGSGKVKGEGWPDAGGRGSRRGGSRQFGGDAQRTPKAKKLDERQWEGGERGAGLLPGARFRVGPPGMRGAARRGEELCEVWALGRADRLVAEPHGEGAAAWRALRR